MNFSINIAEWQLILEHLRKIKELTHEIMAPIALCKLNFQTRICSNPLGPAATHLIFGQTLHLLPYFMCVNSEGYGETVQMCSLTWTFAVCEQRRLWLDCAWAFAVRLCNKYHNLMSWLRLDFIRRWQHQNSKIYDRSTVIIDLIVNSTIQYVSWKSALFLESKFWSYENHMITIWLNSVVQPFMKEAPGVPIFWNIWKITRSPGYNEICPESKNGKAP